MLFINVNITGILTFWPTFYREVKENNMIGSINCFSKPTDCMATSINFYFFFKRITVQTQFTPSFKTFAYFYFCIRVRFWVNWPLNLRYTCPLFLLWYDPPIYQWKPWWIVPDSTHCSLNTLPRNPPSSIDINVLYRHTDICCMVCVYMRYSLCLVFYCIQHGSRTHPLDSEVQAQGMTDGSFDLPRLSQQGGSSGREGGGDKRSEGKKVSRLSTREERWTEGKQSSGMINDGAFIVA